MEELARQAREVRSEIQAASDRLAIDKLADDAAHLEQQSRQSDFWTDNVHAQQVMKQLDKLKQRIGPWQTLSQEVDTILEMVALNDLSTKIELERELDAARQKFDALKQALKFIGPYDDHEAILSLYAGAGGTDAQDWTQMLFRMYSRYFEKNGWQIRVADEAAGDEAGLKSVTLEVKGSFAYGKLKGEHGVHRLVRLSPFNADHLRQTSFAKVEVVPMIDQPDDLAIDDKDLKIDVYRSGGHGGQSVNTTDSAVRITHLPTGLSVAIQNERSQLQNKATALTILRSRLAQLQLEQHQERVSDLKGPNQSAEWGNQIRNYVLHPYKQVKDLRTKYETSDPDKVLDGELDPLIDAYLEYAALTPEADE